MKLSTLLAIDSVIFAATMGALMIWLPSAPTAPAVSVPPAYDPAPVIAELNAEIAARETELDELANALASAVAERNEAVAMLQSAGLVIPVEMPDGAENEKVSRL